ncbi:MAG: carbamoyltransferase [Gammaproteobacteria bacterium]|nr:carbamoyltransferase [Gammaproteobacteria bacterium]
MNIIGINAFHGDSAACLVTDGRLVSAAEEERFRRVKHWAGFPSKAIEFCLQDNGMVLQDIDLIAINSDPGAARWQKICLVLSGKVSGALIREKLRTRKKRSGVAAQLAAAFSEQEFRGKVEHVEHHLAHLASAYTVSPYADASVISVDGFGDFASAAWGFGSDRNIQIEERVYFPHSLGIFYQAMTQALGFPHYGDEYKVMGLAPYGEPKYRDLMDQILSVTETGQIRLNLDYFTHHKTPIGYQWDDDAPQVSALFSQELPELIGTVRDPGGPLEQHHYDLARSIQDAYERAFMQMLNLLHTNHSVDNLAIAGGCGMNSVANGKIHLCTPYNNIYVQSAAGDAGGAIGAAVVAAQRHDDWSPNFVMQHAYWGAEFSDESIEQTLSAAVELVNQANCHVESSLPMQTIFERVSDSLIEGKVVGWFQGAMEWGPRALGNRSILGDPRRTDMKDILNLKIKRRESFRPFAPSVLREHVAEWFESDADVPFMMKVFQIQEHKRGQIPAVTHIDGSGRLQTVTRDHNPHYYDLIHTFYRKTGVPMLLNTSFNENEPVVCQPQEALDCFLRTDMDVLVMGSHMVSRTGNAESS